MNNDLFRNAERVIHERGLDKLLIIDSDVHHFAVLKFLGNFMDRPWRELFHGMSEESLAVSDVGDRRIAGRLKRPVVPAPQPAAPHRSVQKLVSDLARIGADYSVIFADDLLALGAHPDKRFQVAVATGYARWLTEFVFPHEPRVKGLLHLPLWDPAASLRLIEEFGGRSGVLGFQITQTGYGPQHAKDYWEIYAALEERGLTLGFHSDGYWPAFPMFDTFLGAHALSFPAFNVMSLINWVWNGMPERFPKLRCVFFEAGAAVIPMTMARLDTVYRMRPGEAPLLTKLPSEYMRGFFYTVQPLEQPETPEQLRAIFARIGTSQILYASDYPHWDFDMPHSISRMSFLTRPEREAILALNAIRAFGLEKETLTRSPRKVGERAGVASTHNE
jgi:uncharacterized protein